MGSERWQWAVGSGLHRTEATSSPIVSENDLLSTGEWWRFRVLIHTAQKSVIVWVFDLESFSRRRRVQFDIGADHYQLG